MRILSYLSPQRDLRTYPIYDTLCDRKSVMVGLAVGYADESGIRAIDPGQEIIDRLADLTADDAHLRVVAITEESHLRERIGEVFEAVEAGSAVLFLCADGRVLDATADLLNRVEGSKQVQ